MSKIVEFLFQPNSAPPRNLSPRMKEAREQNERDYISAAVVTFGLSGNEARRLLGTWVKCTTEQFGEFRARYMSRPALAGPNPTVRFLDKGVTGVVDLRPLSQATQELMPRVHFNCRSTVSPFQAVANSITIKPVYVLGQEFPELKLRSASIEKGVEVTQFKGTFPERPEHLKAGTRVVYDDINRQRRLGFIKEVKTIDWRPYPYTFAVFVAPEGEA